MRATFMNRLAFADPKKQGVIKYAHNFRVDIDLLIQYRDSEDRDWEISFEGQGMRRVPAGIREGMAQEFRNYIAKRMHANIRKLRYDDFIDMAKAVSIA